MEKAFVPYGAWWSTPFVRWQGSLAGQHSIELAADVTRDALAARKIDAAAFDGVFLGTTVPQRRGFYGAPWLAGMIGAAGATGMTIGQACATSARLLASAAAEVETGLRACVLGVACDRTSWGPHLYYPAPTGPGGRGEAEDWVWDNFSHDPWAKVAMVETAENAARAGGFTTQQQHDLVVLRHAQYREALGRDRAFQRRWMQPVILRRRGAEVGRVEADEGVHAPDAQELAKARPVVAGGTVTGAAQTHPADGNAGMVVTTRDRARELARDGAVEVRLVAFAEARVDKGLMPTAVVPAARRALERAGVRLEDCRAITTHNPFAVNDLWLSRETGLSVEKMNRRGCSLVYGHPQAPTGVRAVIELIEELADAGGGYGLFTGCAAGDTAMAVVVRVG